MRLSLGVLALGVVSLGLGACALAFLESLLRINPTQPDALGMRARLAVADGNGDGNRKLAAEVADRASVRTLRMATSERSRRGSTTWRAIRSRQPERWSGPSDWARRAGGSPTTAA